MLCLQLYLAGHFAQPNSIEFQPAVAWRHQQKVMADLKAQLRDNHAEQLKGIMQEYLKVCRLQPSIAQPCTPWGSQQPYPLIQISI